MRRYNLFHSRLSNKAYLNDMMAARRFYLPVLLLLTLCTVSIRAQEMTFLRFGLLLGEAGLDYLQPSDAGYREIKTAKNSFQHCDFALYSRQEKLEIRFLIEPVRDTNEILNPQLRCMGLVTHLASNDEAAAIAVHNIPGAPYNADWAKAFFFQPKPVFGEWQHCKMLALYKEGSGMAFVFYFFNEADEALDRREVLLQYR